MKYKVIFDTEPVWNENRKDSLTVIFGEDILNVSKFLKKYNVNNVQLCLPAMVLEERIQQKKERAESLTLQINDNLGILKNLGYSQKIIKLKNHDTIFRKLVRKFISENLITILKTPELDSKDILNRAIRKIKPFNDKGAGFKDTIILLSIIKDAKKAQDVTYIFVSRNKADFTEDVVKDFSALTSKNLHIVDDIESLKTLLDKLLPLRLELEKLHNEIKEGIKNKSGTITSELNKSITEQSHDYLYNPMHYWEREATRLGYINSRYPHSGQENIINYDYSDINIDNISSIKDDLFEVKGVFVAKVVRDESGDYMTVFNTDRFEEFEFRLFYNKKTDNISEISFNRHFRITL